MAKPRWYRLGAFAAAWLVTAAGAVAQPNTAVSPRELQYQQALERSLAFNRKNFDSAYYYAQQAVTLAATDTTRRARALYTLGLAHYYHANYDTCTAIFLQALELYRQKNHQDGQMRLLNALGNVFRELNLPGKAMPYFRQALNIAYQLPDSAALTLAYNNMGLIYRRIGQLDSAVYALSLAGHIAQQRNDSASQARVANNLGLVYHEQKQYPQAVAAYQQAVSYLSTTADPFNRAGYYLNLARSYQALQQTHAAEAAANQALRYAGQAVAGTVQGEVYLLLAELNASAGRYQQAYEYATRYQQIELQRLNEARSQSVADLEARYQRLAQQRQIETLQLAQQRNALVTARQRLLLAVAAALLVAVVAIAAVLWIRWRLKNRIHAQLERQNTQLEQQHQLLQQAYADKQLLMQELQHRTGNHFALIQRLLQYQQQRSGSLATHDVLRESQRQLEAIALVNHQLQSNGETLPGKVDLRPYLQRLLTYCQEQAALQQVQIHAALTTVYVDAGTAVVVGLIVNEAITNALKHAFPGGTPGTITVTLGAGSGSEVEVKVQDNGVGIVPVAPAPPPSGTYLMLGFARQIHGSVQWLADQGVTVVLRFPLVFAPHVIA